MSSAMKHGADIPMWGAGATSAASSDTCRLRARRACPAAQGPGGSAGPLDLAR